jgi:hypothetical protein
MVPPIALWLSLIGALVHVFKVLRYAVMVVWPRAIPATLASCCVTGGLLVLPMAVPDGVTSAQGYAQLEAAKAAEVPFGKVESIACRWAIHATLFFYPVSEAIRRHVLRDFKFDTFPDVERGSLKAVR